MCNGKRTVKVRKKSFMERVRFETIIHYEPLNENMRSDMCRGLSVGGLYLKTEFPFQVNEILSLSFSIPTQGQEIKISCKARVAWTNLNNNRRKSAYLSGVGLQFLDLSSESVTALSKFIEECDENKKMNVVCPWCGSYLGLRKGPVSMKSQDICNQCREKVMDEFWE